MNLKFNILSLQKFFTST